MTGRYEDEGGRAKFIRGECHDTRDLPLEDEKAAIYTWLKQTHFISSKCKLMFCIVNSDKACIANELVDIFMIRWKTTKYFGQRLYNKNNVGQG